MKALEAIMTRRSIRHYTEEEVSDDQIEILLRAAMAAPSAVNRQPWHFVVIRDRETLNTIKKIHKFAWMAKEAPAAILVCGDLKMETLIGYMEESCSAAAQNILLSAHAIGLGAVWCGISPRSKRVAAYREKFDLPNSIQPVALIVFGHPSKTKEPADRFKPKRIRYENWNGKK